jgi:hypothetical protein
VNSDLRDDVPRAPPFLLRKLRLWFQITPPEIDTEDPWAEEPPFDPYKFTLPTTAGPVTPARWNHFRHIEGRKFDGVTCEFMESVFFRQEVLAKYEGTSGFDVADNGSVSCYGEWGLTRSTWKLGNELLATAIGDFAEGVPFCEWRIGNNMRSNRQVLRLRRCSGKSKQWPMRLTPWYKQRFNAMFSRFRLAGR